MKSLILASLALMIGLGSMIGTAEARNRYTANQGWNRPHWHHGWHGGWHHRHWHHRHW